MYIVLNKEFEPVNSENSFKEIFFNNFSQSVTRNANKKEDI
jgi:hypothetical protein